jgi:hypothetical protein
VIYLLDKITAFEDHANEYRFRCRTCQTKGRWHVNPNDAISDGTRHHANYVRFHPRLWDRHCCDIYNQEGTYVGTC